MGSLFVRTLEWERKEEVWGLCPGWNLRGLLLAASGGWWGVCEDEVTVMRSCRGVSHPRGKWASPSTTWATGLEVGSGTLGYSPLNLGACFR